MYSAVTPAALSSPELLYRKLGAKLVVGMPFKDIATSGERMFRVFGAGLGWWRATGACPGPRAADALPT